MLKVFFGISICLNIILLIGYYFVYKYSVKGITKKLENYVLNNFLDVDPKSDDWLGGLYDNK